MQRIEVDNVMRGSVQSLQVPPPTWFMSCTYMVVQYIARFAFAYPYTKDGSYVHVHKNDFVYLHAEPHLGT